MGKTVSIHVNGAMAHQAEFGRYFEEGFGRLGLQAAVTTERTDDSELHVVIGPNHAKRENHGKICLYVDRCYWGDHRKFVTLSWLDDNGDKRPLPAGKGMRPAPELQPWKTGNRALFLHDYNDMDDRGPAYASKYYQVERRQHPTNRPGQDALEDALARNDLAIGGRSSAMVAAAVAGLPVITKDRCSPVYEIASHAVGVTVRPDRGEWIRKLSWANWSAEEIRNGTALDYLLCHF